MGLGTFVVAILTWSKVLMIGILIAICWIVEQHASSTGLDSVDHVDCEIGIVFEAVSVTLSILVAVRVHDLSRGDLSHELSEG